MNQSKLVLIKERNRNVHQCDQNIMIINSINILINLIVLSFAIVQILLKLDFKQIDKKKQIMKLFSKLITFLLYH